MISRAKAFATKAHEGQQRKISNESYIQHPVRVANILKKAHVSKEIICAAYLHDVVEDTPYSLDEIEEEFGPRIAELVAAHTEDKEKSWQERKQQTIDILKSDHTEKEIKYLIIADRLDNLLDLEKDLETYGPSVWQHFNADYSKQKWYNESLAKQMRNGLTIYEIPYFYDDFEAAIKRIFQTENA